MDILMKNLSKAIEYASQTGSFNKCNIIKQSENVCVFGLGRYFNEAFLQQNVRERFKVNLICDNNFNRVEEVLSKPEFAGLKGIRPEELSDYKNLSVIIMMGDPREVQKQLKALGIENYMTYVELSLDSIMEIPEDRAWIKDNAEKIADVYEMIEDDWSKNVYVNALCNRIAPQFSMCTFEELCTDGEYFESGIFKTDSEEYFADCGACNGDTIEKFIKLKCGSFAKIFAFEIDEDNFSEMCEKVRNYGENISSKIKCFQMGVWDKNTTLTFGKCENDSTESGSIFKQENVQTAQVVKMDEVLSDEKVTLIKMDIEGAELRALYGCEGIIKEQKPKLAICVYHRLDDFWEIPLYLKHIVPDYKIYLRHHDCTNFWGTVMYAAV